MRGSAHGHLFVYGTLLRQFEHRLNGLLVEHADSITAATVRGHLYYLGTFPALVASRFAQDRVRGELYALRNHEQLLRKLDQYEGFYPAAPQRSLFVRREVMVDVLDREYSSIKVWAYLFNRPLAGAKRIVSGDYGLSRRSHKASPSA
jgi:gamma-glutamylcyclotransferase (GGCT)/AIG2-like uncharacterized protein YtfP